MTLYQIDPNLHPDDPAQEMVQQWVESGLLVPVEALGTLMMGDGTAEDGAVLVGVKVIPEGEYAIVGIGKEEQ